MIQRNIVLTLSEGRGMSAGLSGRLMGYQTQQIRVWVAFKWRDTIALNQMNANGSRIEWSQRCSFETMCQMIENVGDRIDSLLIVEHELTDDDMRVLNRYPHLNVIICGDTLTLDQVKKCLHTLEPLGRKVFVALESEESFVWAKDFLRMQNLSNVIGLIVGSSYLSENARVYEVLGLERFRVMLKLLVKEGARRGWQVWSCSNYCTFEPNGRGDRSKAFVEEQLAYMISIDAGNNIGWITRYLRHLGIVGQYLKGLEDVTD